MTDNRFKGCGTALLTPFNEDLSIDFPAYEKLVRRQIESGIDFLVPLGTSAETPTLNRDEKVRLLEITRKHCAGRPLLVGCGSNSVDATLDNMALAEPFADAFLIVVPFYNKPTQEGMYLYFKTLAERSSKPVIMYNVPGRTGVNMTAGTALRIAGEVDGIIGIKEASGNFEQVKTIINGAPQGFRVLSGDDDMTFDLVKAGANGVISVASNILPEQTSQMVSLALQGRFEEAGELNSRLMPLFHGCFVESNPVPGKEALHQLGLCSNAMRLPLTPATDKTSQTIREILSQWQ